MLNNLKTLIHLLTMFILSSILGFELKIKHIIMIIVLCGGERLRFNSPNQLIRKGKPKQEIKT